MGFLKLFITAFILLFASVFPLQANEFRELQHELQSIEHELPGRVGAYILDLETGRSFSYNENERFPLTSTFKSLACGALLEAVEAHTLDLETKVAFTQEHIVSHSPVTESRTGSEGMAIYELCEATLHYSDNTAANLILELIGGPEALTSRLRQWGDDVTRLDRWETDLNEGQPGDLRDTTTPKAMVENLQRLLLGDTLSLNSRSRLVDWMKGHKNADGLFRASLPEGWQIADRTGAGGFGSRAFNAVIWRPHKSPLLVAIYITESSASFSQRNQAIADFGAKVIQIIQ